jgi:hypothetical protein
VFIYRRHQPGGESVAKIAKTNAHHPGLTLPTTQSKPSSNAAFSRVRARSKINSFGRRVLEQRREPHIPALPILVRPDLIETNHP